jgi:transcription antitermination protein NusB
MQQLYALDRSPKQFDQDIKNALYKSFQDTYQVYLSILELPVVMADALQDAIDVEQSKYSPNSEKIRKNSWMNKSHAADMLFNKAHGFMEKSPINWRQDELAMEQLLNEIKEQEFVSDYIVFDEPTMSQQVYFLEQLFNFLFDQCEQFFDWIEEMYGTWSDDEPTVKREIIKVIKSLDTGNLVISKPITKAQDEVLFSIQLFQLLVEHDQELLDMVANKSSNWDISRISIIDLIIMKMALTEFMYFENIPVKVSINEYLELAKSHSSPQSSKFINGILDPVKVKLISEGKINKSGRGLQ